MIYPLGSTVQFPVNYNLLEDDTVAVPSDGEHEIVIIAPDGTETSAAGTVIGSTGIVARSITVTQVGRYYWYGTTTDEDFYVETDTGTCDVGLSWVENVNLLDFNEDDELVAVVDEAALTAGVQAGLTAQGYTEERSVFLDRLENFGDNVADAVWGALSNAYQAAGTFGLLLTQIRASMSFVGVRTIIASFLDREGVISIDQAADATVSWTGEESDYGDLTDAVIIFKAEYTREDVVAPVFTKTMDAFFDAETSVWTLALEITDTESAALQAGRKAYRFKITATLASGRIVVLERGFVTVDRAIE